MTRAQSVEQTARDAAESAYRQAAEAFLGCDEAEQFARAAAEGLAMLEPRRAAAVRAEVDTACRDAYAAAVEWITTLDAHQPALRSATANRAALVAAAQAFTKVRFALERATPAAQRFLDRHGDVAARVADATAARDRAAQAAALALDAARAAVARTREIGTATDALEHALADAQQQVGACQDPAVGIGPRAVEACAAAEAAAAAVTAEAQRLERTIVEAPKRLRSLATRASGIEVRAESLPDKLSILRRQYSLACSAGLERAGEEVAAAVSTARGALTAGESAVARADWGRALREVDAARTALDTAERTLSAVTERVRVLDEVRAAPQERLKAARFTLRDAQRLVVATGAIVAREVPVLDALAARLDEAPALLSGTHPDYWSYLQEIDAVAAAAHEVVGRTRSAVAGH